jgi:hypothetical protein
VALPERGIPDGLPPGGTAAALPDIGTADALPDSGTGGAGDELIGSAGRRPWPGTGPAAPARRDPPAGDTGAGPSAPGAACPGLPRPGAACPDAIRGEPGGSWPGICPGEVGAGTERPARFVGGTT